MKDNILKYGREKVVKFKDGGVVKGISSSEDCIAMCGGEFLDETVHISEKDFKEIEKRIHGKFGLKYCKRCGINLEFKNDYSCIEGYGQHVEII